MLAPCEIKRSDGFEHALVRLILTRSDCSPMQEFTSTEFLVSSVQYVRSLVLDCMNKMHILEHL